MNAPVQHSRSRAGRARVEPATLREGVLFLAAGGLNTCFGYAAFAAFLWLNGSKELAVSLGTAAGVAFNFGTYGAVFRRTGLARLPHFIAFYLALLVTNILVLRLLTSWGMSAYLGQALVIIFSTPVSFLAMRSWVFPGASRQGSPARSSAAGRP